MNAVANILSRKKSVPVTVGPDATVFEALQIMAGANIGSVIVIDRGRYLGIVTERDYSRKVILNNRHSINTPVSEIMSTDLPRVSPADTIDDCMEMMTANAVRYLPDFEGEHLTGIISMSDIVKQIIVNQKATIDNLNSYIYSH